MNVIFLTVGRLRDIYASEIYSDLMRKFNNEGHNVYVVSPRVALGLKRTLMFKRILEY